MTRGSRRVQGHSRFEDEGVAEDLLNGDANDYSLSLLPFSCGMVAPVLSVSRPVWA